MISRAHVVISGKVQGVWYRAFTQNTAIRLGLSGWVKNLPEGRVEAVFEGRRESIEQALLACRNGPPGACVTDVAVAWESPLAEQGFEIRY